MFVNRQEELAFFNGILAQARSRPAQLLVLYGRRRLGKTALLQHWARYSGFNYTYWLADPGPPALQRRNLYAAVAGVPEMEAPAMGSWSQFWNWLADHLANDYGGRILILDEVPQAAAADAEMLPALLEVWNQRLQYGNMVLVLCGSNVQAMANLAEIESPLYSRVSGEWQLQPLSFHTLRHFFPTWDIEARIALYSIMGGVPAYLSWLDPNRSLEENLSEVVLAPGSMFLAEPQLLLYEQLRELGSYLAVLRAIAGGQHALSGISRASMISRTSLMFYLTRLQELQLVERRLPVLLDEGQRRTSKRGRYHLRDPFFRFYFRFIAPHLEAQKATAETMGVIAEALPELLAEGFEVLAREWIRQQAQGSQALSALPFTPEAVGSHWGQGKQEHVVAINWRTRDVLVGACDWRNVPVEEPAVTRLLGERTDNLKKELPLQAMNWTFHHAVFTRVGLTEEAQAVFLGSGGLVVPLSHLERGLGP
jgi:AAA+ ATPase superfamily predicted ATPase